MLPYNASDMLRAMQQDHGLTVDPEPVARSRRFRGSGDDSRPRLPRWLGAVATYLTAL